MPIYEYQAKDPAAGCAQCSVGFEIMQKMSDPKLEKCPSCGAPVAKQISAAAVGESKSGFDDRAKASGFHKLQKTGKGEYEAKY
ncbi:MAG: FmdB family transcriptional regulator [Verrucomicrobia bacterium]|nr:FmdB family transcriptional regulator [Verrucomicrobiota bacterium]